MANPVSPVHNGWHYSDDDARLNFYYRGTRAGHVTATTFVGVGSAAATTTVTTATGSGVTTGHTINTAGDFRGTAGNLRLGAVAAFATTQPTSAIVMKSGTAPEGAIATSAGLHSTNTIIQKIIADGTVSNVIT